jgi:putative transcriptional regulator
MSDVLKSVHDAAKDLRNAGLIDDMTMRTFDAACLPPVRKYTAKDIRRIRAANHVSQAVFAAYLRVGKTTVQQWEQGVKRPKGASLTLLDIVERKGLEILV